MTEERRPKEEGNSVRQCKASHARGKCSQQLVEGGDIRLGRRSGGDEGRRPKKKRQRLEKGC